MEPLFSTSLNDVAETFGLSERSRELLERADRAADELLLPHAEGYLERRVVEAIPRILAEYGLLGLPVSRDYGGEGADMLTYSLAMQRLGQVGMSVVSFTSVHTSLGSYTIEQWGTEEQKTILREATKGRKILAFALTEPEAGSDPSSLKTSYQKKDGRFILTGEKYLITNGGLADLVLVFARSKDDGRISCFLVDTELDGFHVDLELKEKIGLFPSDTAMFSLENCEVKAESLLGEEGRGLTVAYTSLMSGRLGVASGCLGVIDDCLNSVIERAQTRVQHGKLIGKHQLVQQHVAAIAMDREMARWPTYLAALAKEKFNHASTDRGLRAEADHRIAIAKRIASRCAFDSADRAVQVFGGFGYSLLSSAGRHFCDVRVTRLYEGTDEILDLKIASALLGPEFEAF